LSLKGLITLSIQNRIAALAYALQWYDGALPYLIQKNLLPPDAKKKLEIAVKCRKQAQGTTNDDEKETSLLMSVRHYEKACAALKPVLVDKFYDLYKKKKDVLEKKQNRLTSKFGAVVGLLQKAIGDRLSLQVADAPKPVQYNPALTSLSYNREAVKEMTQQFRAEGILSVFISQLETLSMYAALKSDGAGGWAMDPAEQVQVQQELLGSFLTFAKGADAPRKLVRNGVVKVQQPRQPGAPAAPRPPVSTKGPRVLGFLVPGTAICTVYERMQDELEHNVGDITAGLTTADPVGRIKQLGRYGIQKDLMDVTITGNRAQLKFRPAGLQLREQERQAKGGQP